MNSWVVFHTECDIQPTAIFSDENLPDVLVQRCPVDYKFLDEEVRILQLHLEETGLVFDIVLNTDSPIPVFQQICEQVLDICNHRGIAVVSLQDGYDDGPSGTPIVPLKGNPKRANRRNYVPITVSASEYTWAAMSITTAVSVFGQVTRNWLGDGGQRFFFFGK